MVDVESCEYDASAVLTSGLGLFIFFWFPWLHHILSLADVAMVKKACILPKAVKLN
jgi:hypothetical protein